MQAAQVLEADRLVPVTPDAVVVSHQVIAGGVEVTGVGAEGDPVADAIRGLANRLTELEELVAEQSGQKPEGAEVRPLRRRGGPDSTGG